MAKPGAVKWKAAGSCLHRRGAANKGDRGFASPYRRRFGRQLAPQEGVTHLKLGLLLFKQKKLERAIEEARLAVAYAPENTNAHLLLLGSLFYHNEDPVDPTREALAVSPYDAEIHHLLGVALARKGESIEAFHQLTYYVLLRPDRMEARSELHRALLALINSSDAPKLLHQAASHSGFNRRA